MNTESTVQVSPKTLASQIEANPRAGPRPITIEEYRRRTNKPTDQLPRLHSEPHQIPNGPSTKRRHRGGHHVRVRQRLGELYHLAAISGGATKREYLAEARALKVAEYARKLEKARQKLEAREKRAAHGNATPSAGSNL